MRPEITYSKRKGYGVLRNEPPEEDFLETWPLIKEWLDNNVEGGYDNMLIEVGRYYFKDKETAMLFRLVWC